MHGQRLGRLVREIQSSFPEELLSLTFLQPVTEREMDEVLARSLTVHSPVYLPVFQDDGDLIAVHLSPGRSWKDGIWVKLGHDSAEPRLLASSFKYLPYAFLVLPINIKGHVEEVWEPFLRLLQTAEGHPIPDEEYVRERVDEPSEVMARYDPLNGASRLSFTSRYLGAEEAREHVESLYRELPDDAFALMGVAVVRSKLNQGDAIGPALRVLTREVPHGHHSFDWADGDTGSGSEVLELARVIASPALQPDHPLSLLRDAPYTDERTADVLRRTAAMYRDRGDDGQALIQLRNGAMIAGYHGALTRAWCLELARQADEVDPGCMAASLAHFAAGVIGLEP